MDLLTDLDGATGPKAPPKDDSFRSASLCTENAVSAGSLGRRPNCPHAVVIGAGFGGLAAAIRLGVRGYRVTILEKLDAPGGRASVFRQDGFTFDTGPTIVTAPFLLEELWRICGRDMAADVTLKERRPLVLMVRETPFHLGHLRTMVRLAEMGAVIAPPLPAFYAKPETVDELVDQSVGRALDLFGLSWAPVKRWGSDIGPGADA